MLRLERLTTDYGAVRALNDVSLEVRPGSLTAVLGANGAGKTTLLRTVSGLVRPTAGAVSLDGADITRTPVAEIVRRGLAHVPEGRGVIGELTVEENLRLGGLHNKRSAAKPTEIYAMFPVLEERRGQPASRLSGGERQMLSIGRALIAPAQGAAPRRTVARARPTDRGADHGLRPARRGHARPRRPARRAERDVRAVSVADRGVVLNLGRVVADQPPQALLDDEQLRHHYLGF